MKKTAIAAALLLVSAGAANAAAISTLELTGGSFTMGAGPFDITPGEFADMTVGGYDGGGRIATDLSVNSIGSFQFGTFGPVLISTQADPLADGSNYRPVSGTIDDMTGELSLDLDSWTAWFGGTFFNQGTNDACNVANFIDVFPGEENCSGGAAVTTYDAATGAFTASWSSVVIGGGFNNQVGEWSISGFVDKPVSAVPVPAAVWLFGSGLVGLAGIARRRKAS